jgi:GntP family gluconate:H+ symporter
LPLRIGEGTLERANRNRKPEYACWIFQVSCKPEGLKVGITSHSVALLSMAFAAIAILILLISLVKLHPFVSLVVVSLGLGLAVGMKPAALAQTFEEGVGFTLGHVAVVIALGTILGKMMAESGGADQIARTLVSVAGRRGIPWAMLAVGIVTGLPVFFEVGFVLMIPIAFTVARRSGSSIVLVALPLVAGLSVVHAFVPPHPAAMAAVILYQANIGRTLGYALLIGVPAAVLAGPLYAMFIAPRIGVIEHNELAAQLTELETGVRVPGFGLTVATILLPIVLMLAGGWADALAAPGSRLNTVLRFLGGADVALLIGVLVGFVTFGLMQGISRVRLSSMASEALPATAGAILLIGAGGGFGRILQNSGVSAAVLELAQHAHLSLLLMAWLIAALLRVAIGSSTVAMTTAASIVAPLALHTAGARPELLVIATGAGSIMFSHVNDGGFWLVKSYLNLSVPQTLKTWSILETILSVMGLAGVLLAATVR